MDLEKFLCCLKLETGGLTIGYLHLIAFSMLVVGSLTSFAEGYHWSKLKKRVLKTGADITTEAPEKQ